MRYLRQLAGYHPYHSPYSQLHVQVPHPVAPRYQRHFRGYDLHQAMEQIESANDWDGSDDWDDLDEDWLEALDAEGSFGLALYGEDEPKKRVRPFEAISRVFSKAQEASSKADAAMRAAHQAYARPQVVTREVQKFTATEAAITGGIALGSFGLGWLVCTMVQSRR